jgi:hypothetical protein
MDSLIDLKISWCSLSGVPWTARGSGTLAIVGCNSDVGARGLETDPPRDKAPAPNYPHTCGGFNRSCRLIEREAATYRSARSIRPDRAAAITA